VSISVHPWLSILEILDANHPEKSPLLDEGLVGGLGLAARGIRSAASSKPLSTNELNEFQLG